MVFQAQAITRYQFDSPSRRISAEVFFSILFNSCSPWDMLGDSISSRAIIIEWENQRDMRQAVITYNLRPDRSLYLWSAALQQTIEPSARYHTVLDGPINENHLCPGFKVSLALRDKSWPIEGMLCCSRGLGLWSLIKRYKSTKFDTY